MKPFKEIIKKINEKEIEKEGTHSFSIENRSPGKENRFPSLLFVCSFHWQYPLNQRIHHLIFSIRISYCLFYFPPKIVNSYCNTKLLSMIILVINPIQWCATISVIFFFYINNLTYVKK